MVTEGDSEAAQGEKGEKKGEINPGDIRVPQKDNGGNKTKDREPDEGEEDQFRQRGRCLGMRYGRRHLTRLLDISVRASSRKRFLKAVPAKNTKLMAGRMLKRGLRVD